MGGSFAARPGRESGQLARRGGCGRVATRHLVDHGRRAIAYVSGRADAATDRGRRAGYERALREAGLEPVPAPDRHGSFTREHGHEATRLLLDAQGDGRPDGIVAADDTVALGCLDALAEAGVNVPGEISLVGFDDIPAASLRSVWLTTVSTAARAMGTRAVELLIERIAGTAGGQAISGPRREILPARLVVRGTCGDHPVRPSRARRASSGRRTGTRARRSVRQSAQPAAPEGIAAPIEPTGGRS